MISNGLLTTPTLAIKAGSSALAKHAAFSYVINDVYKTKAAADLPALTGTIADDYKAVYAYTIDAAGNVTAYKSDSVALASDFNWNLVHEGFPIKGDSAIVVGYIFIQNETGSTFTGGTTALDVANLTVAYINVTDLTNQGFGF